MAFYLDKHAVFDTNQTGKFTLALIDVGVFNHHGRFPIGAAGDQRRIGVNLLQDTLFFKYFFNAQHLLYLIANGGFALELQVDMFAQLHAA